MSNTTGDKVNFETIDYRQIYARLVDEGTPEQITMYFILQNSKRADEICIGINARSFNKDKAEYIESLKEFKKLMKMKPFVAQIEPPLWLSEKVASETTPKNGDKT